VLINCAGVIFSGDLDTVFPQDHDYLMDLNLRAAYVLINFFQDMLVVGQGCIVNVSSIKGHKPQPGMISYCMSKAGIEMLTKSAAIELARFGVRVNCVSASFVNTNFYR
jgi:NAD(P)-dependent dehydrogenase (short-subunit alcohol dehydrogenase family)